MKKNLFLLDAFALIFRAYYALIRNPRQTSKGKNTNAQFGFTNALIDIINKHNPSHIAVCFDSKGSTEREELYSAYKANREEAPEDLLLAIPDIKKIITGFNIPIIEKEGYEADDIIGTLAWQAAAKGFQVTMVTPDKDYGQLLTNENIQILKPAYMGNKEEFIDAQKVCEKWNINHISQVIDMLGLMGDAVDNIPGIAGVGEKTAAKLLQEYHSLENVLNNADKIKGALGEKIRKGRENALISKQLATIITNVPVQFDDNSFTLVAPNKTLLADIFSELEFRTLGKRILGESFQIAIPEGAQTDLFGNIITNPISTTTTETNSILSEELKTIHTTPHQYTIIDSDEAIIQLVDSLFSYNEICIDTETTGIDANNVELVGISFSVKKHEAYYLPMPDDYEATKQKLHLLQPLFSKKNITWIGQNIKYDILVIKWYGIELKGQLFDTMVAHYLIEPDGKRNMDILSEQYLHYQPISITELIGKKGKAQASMRHLPIEKVAEYAAEDADITLQLKEKIAPLIQKNNVEPLFQKVETPLIRVLANMEFEGVKIDVPFLQEYATVLEKEARLAEEQVYNMAGVRFNLASPKQLGEVLFEKLKLDEKAKKTKTGQYATSEDILLKLAKEHPIAAEIIAFRELTKLKNTYVDTLPQLINPKTGRVHTSYNQTIAVTGRLSSNNPNLQNIPIRTNRGREIRKAFIPRDTDHILLSADYSQIELRIVAAISGDENMCEAFRNGIDIHSATAAKVYGIPVEAVSKEQRYKAKSVNFGIIYGQGAFGLASNLNISRSEAKEIIENYKQQFFGITTYMEESINFARKNGYVQTIMGRKNWLKDINSSNAIVRGYAERNAINSPIQGTAADMIKMAMIRIDHALKAQQLQSKMILQVHDELVFDVLQSELEQVKKLVIEEMKNALPLPNNVPIEAEAGIGLNWLEAH